MSGCVVEYDHEYHYDQQDHEIVGGADTQISSVPWQVSLQTRNGRHFCGGSILSSTWIVTAAHCTAGAQPSQIQVLAGVSRLSQAVTGQTRLVTRLLMYPGYSDPVVGKDIALLELQTPLTLDGVNTRAIRPAKSADVALTAPNVVATVSGWGALAEGGLAPDNLQSVQVPIISLTDASNDYAGTGVPVPLTADQLAAGYRGVGGKDSCQGDSGGPLVVANQAGDGYLLAGVVSWGNGCARAQYPGLYARVSSFTSWLDSYVGGAPIAVAGQDVVAAFGATVQLDASASRDAGFGDIASYSWSQVSGSPVTLQGSTSRVASFVAPGSPGAMEFALTVTDDQGLTTTDTLVVTTRANVPDTGTSGDGLPSAGSDGSNGQSQGQGAHLAGGCSAGSDTASGLFAALFLLALFRVRRRATDRIVGRPTAG